MASKAPWKLGFNTFWWEGLEREAALRACLDALVEIGYEAVEFKVDSFGLHPARAAIVRAAHAARKAGLTVSNLVILRTLAQPEKRERSVADVSEAIRICAAAEIGVLNFTSGGPAQVPRGSPDDWWMPPTQPDPAAFDTLTRSLEPLTEVAEAEGIDLALEACIGNLVCDFGTTLELLARCAHPRLNLTFDPSHYVLAGQDVGLAVRRLGRRIRHVHFKDAIGHAGALGRDFIFPILGEGGTDWAAFFAALRGVGYGGVLSVEFESFRFMSVVFKRDPVAAARLSKTAADAVLASYAGQGS